MSITAPNANFAGYWQVRIYDKSGKLVDLPQSDIEQIDIQDQINGGSGIGTITFRRNFNQIGALGYGYTFLIWFWAYGATQPVDPWYGGHLVDFDQEQLSTTGRVIARLEGDSKLLDAAIVTESIAPSVGGNPALNAAAYCTHLLTTYQPPSFAAASVPASMFNLLSNQFDGTKLGAALDTVTKQGRDTSGVLFTWTVRTRHDLTRQVIVQKDQNPNVVSGVKFKHLFLESQLDQYKITNKYRDIVNVVAVYGGKDPSTGQQAYGVYEDATSVGTYGAIEDKISVPAITSNAGCQAYAQTWLDLNAYPQAQGTARLLTPDPTIQGGTWVQIWETPGTATAYPIIKQVRAAVVKVLIKGERIEQTIATVAPTPYLDAALYKMGLHTAVQTAIANKPLPVNTQTLYVRTGGYVTATASSPAKIALAATDAVFPAGEVQAAALALTQLTDNSGGPNNGKTGDGYYTISLTSSGAYVITQGSEPAASATQQNLCGATVVNGAPFVVDKRTIGVTAAAVNGAIDYQGNLLATAFPGGITIQKSGTYAGWGVMTVASLVDAQSFTAKQNVTIWAKWVALYPSTGAFGYGPQFNDGVNNLFIDTRTASGNLYNSGTSLSALYANTLNDGAPHTFLMGLTYLGSFAGTNYWHVLAYADGKCICSWSGSAVLSTTVRPGFAADAASQVYIKEFAIGTPPVAPQTKNLAVNGTFSMPSLGSDNANPPTAKQLVPGWQYSEAEGGDQMALLTGVNGDQGQLDSEKVNSTTLESVRPATSAAGWSAWSQRIPVTPSAWIALRAWVFWQNVSNGLIELIWYKSDGTVAVGSGTRSTTGAATFAWFPIYSANGASGWQLVEHVMQVPPDAAWMDFEQAPGWSADGVHQAYAYLGPVSIVAGQIPVPANESTINLGNGVGGQLGGSTFIKPQGSLIYTSGISVPNPSTSSAGLTTYNVAGFTGYFSDGSNTAFPAVAPTYTLNPSTTYYFNVYAIIASGIIQVDLLGTPSAPASPTPQTNGIPVSDGHIPMAIGLPFTTPAAGVAGGSSGTSSCPLVDQLIETLERGFVPAGTLRVGEHLRDPDEGWNQIEAVEIMPCTGWRIRCGDDEIGVNDTHAIMDAEGRWVEVTCLEPEARVKRAQIAGGGVMQVDDAREIGPDMYAAITCERHRYVLGRTFGHNSTNPNGCPSVDQEIETLERGFVLAGTLKPGEHLRDPFGRGWNEIEAIAIKLDAIYKVTTRYESVRVNAGHLMTDADGAWRAVTTIPVGTALLAHDLKTQERVEDRIVAVRCVKRKGPYAAIRCKHNVYALGRSVGHNINTL